MMLKKYSFWLLLFIVVGGVTACNFFSKLSPVQQRAKRALDAQGDIVIGVVSSRNTPSFFEEGVMLAVTEINARGGLLSRKIRPIYLDDQGDAYRGQRVAKQLAANPDVIAVVGHLRSQVAIPVSIIYEQAGILFLSPGATDPNFTRYGGDYTFRNIPSGEEIGRQMARFAARQKYQQMVVLNRRDEDTERRVTDNFKAQAVELGIKVLTTKSYFDRDEDFRALLSDLKKNYTFDAIFIAGRTPTAAQIIKQARDLGITTPFLGTDGLDSPELTTIAGRAAEGTTVVTVFDAKQPVRQTRDFVKRFKTTYGVDADTWSAQGYDALQVVAHAIETSDSTVPLVLSSTLRFMEHWEGVTGAYNFTRTGDIAGKKIFFKTARGGGFEFLEQEAEEALKPDPLYVVEDITLRIPMEADFTTLDPGLMETANDTEIYEQLFLGLTGLNPKTYEAAPRLATSWQVSAEGLVYTFPLRQDVKWTDGTPVTAHDVVWTIQRNIRPDFEAMFAYMLYPLKNARAINTGENPDPTQIGVRAADDFTVEFTLEHPTAYFPALVGTSIYRPLPRHVLAKYGAAWTEQAHIRTNGAYRLAIWERGVALILRRNPLYYDASRVAIPEVRYYTIPNSAIGMAMYEHNELDILGGPLYLPIPENELTRIKAHPVLRKEFFNQPAFATTIYGFNTKRPPTDNPLVRKAISAAIDRRMLVELRMRGGQEPAATFTRPPTFGAVDPQEGIGIRFNPTQAKQWLAEAGYPDGQGLPELSILYPTDNPNEYSKTAHPVRDFLKHYLNIDAKLVGVNWDEYQRLLQPSPETPNLFWATWITDYSDANGFLYDAFYPGTQYNLSSGWENREFADSLDKALQITDPEQRKALYKRAEQILCEEDAVVMPLFYGTAPTLVKTRIKGWYNMAIGGQHIYNWVLQK